MIKNIRKLHELISIVSAPYLLLVIATGIFLLVRNDFNFIKPKLALTDSKSITLSHEEVLTKIKNINEIGINSWSDVSHYRVYPNKGYILVRTKNDYQIQVDGQTGYVLSYGPLRTNLLIRLHEGSFWGGKVGRYIFVAFSLLTMTLLITGIYLIFKVTFKSSKRSYL